MSNGAVRVPPHIRVFFSLHFDYFYQSTSAQLNSAFLSSSIFHSLNDQVSYLQWLYWFSLPLGKCNLTLFLTGPKLMFFVVTSAMPCSSLVRPLGVTGSIGQRRQTGTGMASWQFDFTSQAMHHSLWLAFFSFWLTFFSVTTSEFVNYGAVTFFCLPEHFSNALLE